MGNLRLGQGKRLWAAATEAAERPWAAATEAAEKPTFIGWPRNC